MSLSETFFLLLAGCGVWFWLDSLKAREIAVHAAEAGCAEDGCQFLDETVASKSLGFGRDGEGRLRIKRVYAFEYSDTGNNRRQGSVAMLGHEVEWLSIRPQLYVVPKAPEHDEHLH